MNKIIPALAAALLSLGAHAAPVGPRMAEAAARSFVTNTLQLKDPVGLTLQSDGWAYDGMYLFDMGEGFVLVAADDAARPVLAYSLDGAFRTERIPAPLKGLLDTYQTEIELARRDRLAPDPAWAVLLADESLLKGTKEVPAAVGPLVTTRWGQRTPYNSMCPGNVPSGCVATATTQVMRFWGYPAFGHGDHGYNCADFGYLQADFAHERYDWANMPVQVTSASPAAERTAVATLTYHVGVSVNMAYDYMQSGATTGDGTYSAFNALQKYFHYNRQSMSYHTKGSTDNDAWTDFLMAELRHLRPILYDGAGPTGGHSFICDGYDSLRLLHFNLGEDGEGDGYYAIGAITYSVYNLNQSNGAIIGIQPEYGIYASDTVVTYHRAGGASQVWVSASDTALRPWNASVDAPWVTLSDTGFAQLGAMTVSAEENTTGTERMATVTLRQGDFETTFLVKQAAYDEEDFCPLTVYMENSRGEAWASGAHVSFESPQGMVYATATHSVGGSSSTATVSVAPHDVVVRWVRGGALDRYYGYTVVGPSGDTLVAVKNAYYNGTDQLIVWPCVPVGISPVAVTLGITVAPNPSNGHFRVEAPSAIRSVQVLNSVGQPVPAHCSTLGNASSIHLSDHAAGLYVLRVTTDGGTFTQRLILNP